LKYYKHKSIYNKKHFNLEYVIFNEYLNRLNGNEHTEQKYARNFDKLL